MKTLDIERIMATNIPDIHPAYGGVRGKTMSSRGQGDAWPVIKEAGVDTIIDLRNDGANPRMMALCEEYGMEYFYYPVDNHADMIRSMVDLFPELCRRIDRGCFYIACAMGLHRTDIALCTYWVFYGADWEIEPPVLRGYLKESGHDTSKIFRVLNAFYYELADRNGHEPMPMQEFKRRKQVVNEQSKRSTEKTVKMKKRVYVDMDGVLVDFQSGLDLQPENIKKEYEGRFDEIPGLFAEMKPMPGAIEAMHTLQEHFDLYILSTAPWKNPSAWSDKVKWVTRYLDDVFHKRMVITHCKNLCKGDYLIDDRGKNGTSEFEGEWIPFGNDQFPDWESVVQYLLKQNNYSDKRETKEDYMAT